MDAPVLEGDILFATHPAQGTYLCFSNSLPLVVIGQFAPNYGWFPGLWEIKIGPARHIAGRGSPPERIAWSHWLEGLEHRDLPEPWLFTSTPADGNGLVGLRRFFRWSGYFAPSASGGTLLNSETGEQIEMRFQP